MQTAVRSVRNLTAALASAYALLAVALPATAQTRYTIRALDPAGCVPIALNDQATVTGDCGTAVVCRTAS